ncbi:MAG: DNA-3-methyladenine glycosylase I, partial [Phycisphaeraceae bacterium]|nr:DNA-3-methyladenine glycosylase I [Phycisphaeraceae bacterium]
VNPGIVRNRLKIAAAIQNARAVLRLSEEAGSLSTFLWRYVDQVPRQNAWTALDQLPARTELSDRMSKDLKQHGFTFVGSTICYSLMQAVGMVNDHLVSCYRHAELRALGRDATAGR